MNNEKQVQITITEYDRVGIINVLRMALNAIPEDRHLWTRCRLKHFERFLEHKAPTADEVNPIIEDDTNVTGENENYPDY